VKNNYTAFLVQRECKSQFVSSDQTSKNGCIMSCSTYDHAALDHALARLFGCVAFSSSRFRCLGPHNRELLLTSPRRVRLTQAWRPDIVSTGSRSLPTECMVQTGPHVRCVLLAVQVAVPNALLAKLLRHCRRTFGAIPTLRKPPVLKYAQFS
jgi:hypothetical protein